MTKEEAISEIEKQSACGVNGFQVLSMDSDDIEMYGDDALKKRYAKMTDSQKAKLLSLLMDEIYDTLEEGDSWGFGNLFRNTMYCIDVEERRDEIIGNAEKEA